MRVQALAVTCSLHLIRLKKARVAGLASTPVSKSRDSSAASLQELDKKALALTRNHCTSNK
jgi:hypothetical protein